MSIVLDSIKQLDRAECGRILTQRLRRELAEASIKETDYSRIVGIEPNRLEEIFATDGRHILKPEFIAFCISFGIGYEEIFGVPPDMDRDTILKEYEIIASLPDGIESAAFCGPIRQMECDIETIRSVLILFYLRKCLQQYPTS
jgi:hypothetical protein